jgi:2-polyprenyl-3-methyl-5-hydroxy-6-metoxy-1,4-benzoquinol methylase
MKANYYQHVRSEIAPLLPATARRIVDVGCGSGATLAWLRSRFPDAHTIGLEGQASVMAELERNANEAHVVDLNYATPDLGEPDLMLFLDVLEHVPDPVAVLTRLTAQLADGGHVIVSVPNVAHPSVSVPLMLLGEFKYRDAGILDRTHLRFFVRRSAVELMTSAGLAVDRGLFTGFDGVRGRLYDGVTLGALRSRLAKQFILRGSRASASSQGVIRWAVARKEAA